MVILKKQDWVSGEKLRQFILECQDLKCGGISDRPGNRSDIFHTLFGISALSMLGDKDMKEIDPRYCMSKHVTKRMGL